MPVKLTCLLHHVPLDLNMSLVAHSLKKDPYPIGIFHFPFKYSREIFQRAILYYHLIAGLNLHVSPDEAIFFYIGLNQCDEFFIDRGRTSAKTDYAVNASRQQ